MLDLNMDAFEVGFASDDDPESTPTAGSVVSTTTSNNVGKDEVNCNCSSSSLVTLNFSSNFGKNGTVHIDDEAGDNVNELQLFPTSPSAVPGFRTNYRLDLSSPEAARGVQLGLYKTKLPVDNPPQPKKSRRGPRSRSSQYRGVTFYRRTGRWESHIWDCGKQVYLGGFDTAHAAARAYDRAAVKFRGVDADINFNVGDYEEDMKQMVNFTKEEFVHILRRQSSGFPRGSNKHRIAALQKPDLREAGNAQVLGNRGYDKAAIQCNWREPVTGFESSKQTRELSFAWRDGGCGSSIDLSLGISLPSNGSQGNGAARALRRPLPSGEMAYGQSHKAEAIPAQRSLMSTEYPQSWPGIFSGLPQTQRID